MIVITIEKVQQSFQKDDELKLVMGMRNELRKAAAFITLDHQI
jgi:hypothetical protein